MNDFTKDKRIAVFKIASQDVVYLDGVCMCHQCCSRGNFEFQVNDFKGNYVDYVKLSNLLNGEDYTIGLDTLKVLMLTVQSEAIVRMNRAYQNEEVLRLVYLESDSPCTNQEINDMVFEVPGEYYQRKLSGKTLVKDPRYSPYGKRGVID